MDVKEKLIELLEEPCGGRYPACELADYLIPHGVTVQEWISVKDRLPEADGSYLVTTDCFGRYQKINIRSFAKDGETVSKYDLAGEKNVWYRYDSEYGYVSTDSVTHWMPLPAPPKKKEN